MHGNPKDADYGQNDSNVKIVPFGGPPVPAHGEINVITIDNVALPRYKTKLAGQFL
jgi:hypothetical protein